VVTVCKRGAAQEGTFNVSGRSGVTVNGAITLGAGHCQHVFQKAAEDDVTVTVTEPAVHGMRLDRIEKITGGVTTPITGTNTVSVVGDHGAVLVFHNTPVVTLCKVGGSGTFTVSGRAGIIASSPLTLAAGACTDVFEKTAADDVTVTITETPAAGTHVDHIERHTLGQTATAANTNTISLVGDHGGVVTFFNASGGAQEQPSQPQPPPQQPPPPWR
jgi:hypothetical protein